MGHRKFSEEFKEAIISKIMNRGDQTIREICRQEGVVLSCASRWMSDRANVSDMTKQKMNGRWTAEEKFKILIQINGLSEEDLGIFLRKEGLHSHQIGEWRLDILQALGSGTGKSRRVKDGSAQRIRELEKDLHRKDKALAEASALLILQKKVNLIWGNKSEDEK